MSKYIFFHCAAQGWKAEYHVSSLKGQARARSLPSLFSKKKKKKEKVPDLTSCLVEATSLENYWNCIIPHLVEASFPLNEGQVTIKSGSQNNPVASLHSECLTSRIEEADVPPLKWEGRVVWPFTLSPFTHWLNRNSCQTHRTLNI